MRIVQAGPVIHGARSAAPERSPTPPPPPELPSREQSMTPPPPPEVPAPGDSSSFQPEPGELERFCTDFEILPPPTPNNEMEDEVPSPPPETEPPQGEDDVRLPSTIFARRDTGERDSLWGPPTRSMTKKKGWVEPEKPITKPPVKQEVKKIVADENELFNLFQRRHNGGKVKEKDLGLVHHEEDIEAAIEAPVKDTEIGGNIRIRISYTSQSSTLHVNINQADDIFTKHKNKACNPYAIVTLLGDYEVFKTKVAPKTQTPVWNETFSFALPLKFLQSSAVLVVVYNRLGENSEEFSGEVHVSLAEYKHFKVIDDWYPLEDMRGEETIFDGYKELQKVLRSLKTKAPRTLPDTLRQDELRNIQ